MIAYDGSKFHGFAKQPGVKTIEGEILKRLNVKKLDYISRTDSGVSAFSQLIYIKEVVNPLEANSKLPNCIIIHKVARKPSKKIKSLRAFVLGKEYIYVSIYHGESLRKLEMAINFINASPRDYTLLVKRPQKYPQETLKMRIKASFERKSQFLLFKFRGRYFLWEQIRRLVTLIKSFALGYISEETFLGVFRGIPPKTGIGPAPPEGLALWSIKTRIKFRELISEDVVRKWLLSRLMNYAITYSKSWVFVRE